jgi:hypothetical protein
MLIGVIYLAIISGNTPTAHTAQSAQVAIGFVAAFLLVGGVVLFLRSKQKNVGILHTERPAPLLQTEPDVPVAVEGD